MTPIRKRWSRRDFLRAAGITGGAAALSAWMPAMSAEAGGTPPRRLLLVSHGNGSVLEEWRRNPGAPFRDGQALPELTGPILAPLERHRQNLMLLDGVDVRATYTGDDGGYVRAGHINKGHAGSSVLWTGVNGGGSARFEGDAGEFPAGPSVDQVVNDRIGEGRRTLQLSVWNRPLDPRSVYNYSTSGAAPLALEPNPQVAFDEVFRDGFGDTASQERDLARRQQTFSVLRGQLSRLRGELPMSDRDRFDQHVEGLAGLEARLSASVGAVCSASDADRPSVARDFRDDTPSTLAAQTSVMLHAFACDRVRVGTLQLIPENSWSSAPFLSQWRAMGGGGVHTVSHLQNADPNAGGRRSAVDKMAMLNRFAAEGFAALLDQMKAMGLLDDTLVVWAPSMSHAGYHDNRNVPVVVAQGANGPWRGNRYLRWGTFEQPADGGRRVPSEIPGTVSNNDLLVSICHAMGLNDVTSFGTAGLSSADGLDGRLV